jgi:hypothetical protein
VHVAIMGFIINIYESVVGSVKRTGYSEGDLG